MSRRKYQKVGNHFLKKILKPINEAFTQYIWTQITALRLGCIYRIKMLTRVRYGQNPVNID